MRFHHLTRVAVRIDVTRACAFRNSLLREQVRVCIVVVETAENSHGARVLSDSRDAFADKCLSTIVEV